LHQELAGATFVDVIIDEAQRMPELFPLLRALVDRNRVPSRFLLLGSSSPNLTRQASESLAGRITYHELTPFSIKEIGKKFVEQLWTKGGFPNSFLSKTEISLQWRESFIETYIGRDIRQMGYRVPEMQLRRFWSMLAHSHGQQWNASTIANSLGTSPPTVKHYLDILQDGFLIRQLQPYFANVKKRLVKVPKMYIRDSGILHSLLKIESFDSLLGHPIVGASWEGFVIEQIMSVLPDRSETFFYRTSAGSEVDLVAVTPVGKVCFEIKYSQAPQPTKGFWNAIDDIEADRTYIIYPGNESYPIRENVTVLPITQLAEIF